MEKQAPSLARLALAIGFALSCFAILVFLWVTFGGPTPLASKSYRITAHFPQAAQLGTEADVRVGGVRVGKVKSISLGPAELRIDGHEVTEAEIEIEPRFAPINSDARAILRQKTLTGETFVELTSGTDPGGAGGVALGEAAQNPDRVAASAEPIPEGGTLEPGQVEAQVQIDQVFNAFDAETREAFQRWQQSASVAVQDRGIDLNDAFGNLGPFFGDFSDTLSILRRQRRHLRALVRDTGEVFEALSEREQQLAGAISGSHETFGAIASQDAALRETFRVLPTFQRELRATLARLDTFQEQALPLARELGPVADELTPTLLDVRRLSPRLVSLFGGLDRLNRVSRRGLPSLQSTLRELGPVLRGLDPYLANLNPVIRFLLFNRTTVTDFLSSPAAGIAGSLPEALGQPGPRFTLQTTNWITEETLGIHQDRLSTNRGKGPPRRPFDRLLAEERGARLGGFPSFDCDHTGGERVAGDGREPPFGPAFAPCFVNENWPAFAGGGRYPQLRAEP